MRQHATLVAEPMQNARDVESHRGWVRHTTDANGAIVCCNASMLPLFSTYPAPERHDSVRATAAILLLIGLFALLAVLPKRDPTKVVSSLRCSIVSESQVSQVFGIRMRLMPTEGDVCHYVASNTSQQADLFVVALHDGAPAVSSRALRAVFVQRGSRRFEFVVVPEGLPAAAVVARERRLAAVR